MNDWEPLVLHVTCCQFREDCDYVCEFRFSRQKSLVDFFGIGLCTCQEICIFICSFNLPKFMKSCRANLPFLYRVSPKKYTTLHMRCSVVKLYILTKVV